MHTESSWIGGIDQRRVRWAEPHWYREARRREVGSAAAAEAEREAEEEEEERGESREEKEEEVRWGRCRKA